MVSFNDSVLTVAPEKSVVSTIGTPPSPHSLCSPWTISSALVVYTVFCRLEMLLSPAPVLKSLLETSGLELGSMKAGQVRMARLVEQFMGSCKGQGLRTEVADASQGPACGAAQGRRDPFLGKQGLSFPRRPENHTSYTKNLEGGKTQWREVGENVAGLGNDAALAGTQEICTT